MSTPKNEGKPEKVDLASLRANQRKRGRTSQVDQSLVDSMLALEEGEGFEYAEASMKSDQFRTELTNALPAIQREKKVKADEATSIFENRWISRFRQRAQAGWELAGLPEGGMEFVVMKDGRIFVGRK